MKIRVKLLLAFGSIILLSVFLTLFAITSISAIISFKGLNEELDNLALSLERTELAAKEFLYEGYKSKDFQGAGRSKEVDKFNEAIAQANKSLETLAKSDRLKQEDMRLLAEELLASKGMVQHFFETQSLLKKRGFKDFGLEGSLRKAIHDLEKSSLAFDKVTMLTLRRHEKDFFLRKDLKYQEEFNKTALAFHGQLASSNPELEILLRNYEDEFNQIVAIEKQLGLTDTEGTKGMLFQELATIREKAVLLQQQIRSANEGQISYSRMFLLITFFVQLALATVLAFVYADIITKVIKEIRLTMQQLAQGIFPKPLQIKTTEEIGQTKIAINQFLERLQQASGFAEKLGAGELTANYDERYNNDVLARSIISMQQKLREAEAVQTKINWTNEGAARFNDILKNEGTELSELGDRILKLVTQYLKANQSALYVINEEEKCFDRIATYAYGKKRYVDEKVPLESGLLGQCAAERETVYLKEIPHDYVKITSGLGEATPNNVLITPLKIRGEVKGVLELASFEIFEPHHIEFIEKQAENIAAILSSRQLASQTQFLLAEAQKRQQELAQQEEEMRQHAEELQATQEEMHRQREELEREVHQLKSKLALHEVSLN